MEDNIRIVSVTPITLQYYVPFRFDDNLFDEINKAFGTASRRNPDGQPAACWQESSFPIEDNTYFYSHVLSMMNVRKNSNSLCRSWQCHLPENNRFVIAESDGMEVCFTFANVFAHLFRTGIGFLGYQAVINHKEIQTAEQLIRFQRRLKELKRTSSHLFMLTESDVTGSSRRPVRLDKILADLLLGTCTDLDFFSLPGNERRPPKALLFSYLCYDCPDHDSLREIAVLMAMGYNQQRKPAESVIRSCQELGENVCFYVTQDGCAVAIAPNDLNRHFFLSSPPFPRYHFIYLITLYQHYSLLNFTMRISHDFPSDTRAYLKEPAYADRMQEFTTDINTFLMKSDLATVSNIQYHNIFYAASRKALNIEEDKQSLRSGFESMVSIQKSMQLSQQKKHWREQDLRYRNEQEMQNEHDRWLNTLVSCIAILTFISESREIIRLIRTVITQGLRSVGLYDILSAVICIVLFVLLVLFIRHIWKRKPPEEPPEEE